MQARFISICLRFSGMAFKLLLTSFIAKYFSLESLGTYGLVFAFTSIAAPLYGFRFDYVASREIVNLRGISLAQKIRDQFVLYVLTYAFAVFIFVILFFNNKLTIDKMILVFIVLLSILESCSWVCSANLVALNKQLLANFLFFIRSSSWIPLAIGICYFSKTKYIETVFICWTFGLLLNILINISAWSNLPFKQTLKIPIDWMWINNNLKPSFCVWIGSLCLAGSGYIDRILAEHFFERTFVGVISFYSSFCAVIFNLMNSGIFSFQYPKMIAAYQMPDKKEYIKKCKLLAIQSFISASILSVLIGVFVNLSLPYFGKKELLEYQSIFWGMLFSMWLRCCSEFVYYMMYSEKSDEKVFIGNLIFFLSSTGFNLTFYYWLGKNGVFFGSVLSIVPFVIFRIRFLLKRKYD